MMKRFSMSLGLLLLGATILLANPISPRAARIVAEKYFQKSAFRSSSSIELSYTHAPQSDFRSGNGQAYYYIFNRGSNEGFVIVGGDDRMQEILAYSDEGHFDINNVPKQVKWWLSQYDIEIKSLYNSNNTISPIQNTYSRSLFKGKGSVAPLLEQEPIRWGQDAPFNLQTPINKSTGTHCPTGCVATAVSQIMRYHKWPDSGVGKHEYMDGETKREVTLGKTYEWDKMPGEYKATITKEQEDAIALLLSDVGLAISSIYGGGATGAWEAGVVRAMRENFKYQKNLCLKLRIKNDPQTWEQLIRNELDNNRPVLYCGAGYGGGHSFVCDGYNEEGLYHFNWGWEGKLNGFYSLSALIPGVGGTGAGLTGNYSLLQSIIVNLIPDKSGNTSLKHVDVTPNVSLRVLPTGDKTLDIKACLLNQGIDVDPFYSFRTVVYDAKGNNVLNTEAVEFEDLVLQQMFSYTASLDTKDLADGNYKIAIEYAQGKGSSEFLSIEGAWDEPSEAFIKIENGKVKLEKYNVEQVDIEVTKIVSKTGIFAPVGKNELTVTLHNPSKNKEFFGPFRLLPLHKRYVNKERFMMHTRNSELGQVVVRLAPGETKEVTIKDAIIGVAPNQPIAFYIQTPDIDPKDPFTDFGFYRARMANSHLRLIKGDYMAKLNATYTRVEPGLTVLEASSYNILQVLVTKDSKTIAPTFTLVNAGRTHIAKEYGSVYGVLYLKDPVSGVYLFTDISSNTYKERVQSFSHENKFTFTPEFTAKEDWAKYEGQEGFIILHCLMFNGTKGGMPIYGACEVPIRMVKELGTNTVKLATTSPLLFPNPANTFCEVRNERPIVSVSVFSITGEKVLSQNIPAQKNARINVENLANGAYILKVKTIDGAVISDRLYVQH